MLLLLLVLLLSASPSVAQSVGGPYFRDNCLTITTPVTNKALCWDQTTAELKRWGGATWISVSGGGDVTRLGDLPANAFILGNGTASIKALALTGYVKGAGASAPTASATVPTTDLSGALQAAQFPALTGDVTTPAGSLATTLAASGVTPGTYSKVTVDAKGRVTVGATTDLSGADVTGNLPVTRLNSGTGASGTTCWFGDATWKACTAGAGGTVTNTGALPANQLLLGNGGVDIKTLGSAGSATTVLHGGSPPTFAAVDLSADTTGAVPNTKGGTGQNSSGWSALPVVASGAWSQYAGTGPCAPGSFFTALSVSGVATCTAGGGMSGSGAATRVAVFSDTTTVTGFSAFVFASATARLTINNNAVGIPTPPAGTLLHLGNADGSPMHVTLDTFAGAAPAFLGRAARGSPAALAAVQLNDQLVGVVGLGYDGANYSPTARASIACYAGGTWTAGSQATLCTIATTPSGSTTLTERLRVTEAGRVGIGTAAPAAPLHVLTGANLTAFISGDGAVQTSVFNGTFGGVTAGWVGTDTSHSLAFYTAGSAPRVLITTAGNMGIGVTTPAQRLDVAGNAIINANASTTLPTFPGVLQVAAATGAQTGIVADAFGDTQGAFIGRSANGTPTSRSAKLANQALVALIGVGAYDATNYGDSQVSFGGFAAENWSVGSRGTFSTAGVTALGTTTLIEAMRWAGVSGGAGFRVSMAPTNTAPSWNNSRPLYVSATTSGTRAASFPFSATEYIRSNTFSGLFIDDTDSSTAATSQLGDRTAVTAMVRKVDQAGFTGTGAALAGIYQGNATSPAERIGVMAYFDAFTGSGGGYGLSTFGSMRAGATPGFNISAQVETFCGVAACADHAVGVHVAHLETVGTSVTANAAYFANMTTGGSVAGYQDGIAISNAAPASGNPNASFRVTSEGRVYILPRSGITTTAASPLDALWISAGGGGNGANIKLSEAGQADVFVRASTGNFQILNTAYSAVLFSMNQIGGIATAGQTGLSTTVAVGCGTLTFTNGWLTNKGAC